MNWVATIFAIVLMTIFVGMADSVRSIPQMLIIGFLVVAGVFFFRRRVSAIPTSIKCPQG